MGNQVTKLAHEAVEAAVTDACRWDSPYFAHGRLSKVLDDDLFAKIDRLPADQLALLAADLYVDADPTTVKARIYEFAAAQVDRNLDSRTAALHGWKPLHPEAPALSRKA